ncbi:hypothetical protein F3N42_09540 [Marinihelvus fidelis]|uniref:Uncharacterized protein n=1 Tax=Marinihelvus fidelis TaxID=2613842 RepID=A0A5N0TE22_9GAMM|nr:hypothetical protein [Marinihelvus fidelis]KAA9131549.1 hypothetical protein F3N42_09540 [Marinihelvus fidelis]
MPNNIHDVLVLGPCADGGEGCVPSEDPWRPPQQTEVVIVNLSGHEQSLTNISNALLTPVQHNQITIPAGKAWVGRVGRRVDRGTYTYNACTDDAGPRNGTIDPA